MKSQRTKSEIEMRRRFDFSKPTRGRFYERYQNGHTVTLLDHDPDAHLADPLDKDGSSNSTREIGKRFFVSQVEAAGLKVAEPLRDPSIDYLIYRSTELSNELRSYAVKVKTSIHKTFSLHKTDIQGAQSLLAYVWNAKDPEESVVYALTYREALRIVESKPYGRSDSWLKNGGYSVTDAGLELMQMLEPYRMTQERWQERLQSV